MSVKGSGRTNPLVQLVYQVYPMSWLQGPPLDNDECDSHEAPPVVVVPVRVESRVESRSKSKRSKSGGTEQK